MKAVLPRHQLSSYSPLSLPGLVGATRRRAGGAARVEHDLAALLSSRSEVDDVVLTGSGTQALQMAIGLGTAGREGRVALPAYSCYDIVSAAIGAGARVRFYDVDPSSLTPDLPSLRDVLATGVDAVVVGYLFGFPIDWDEIRGQCERAGTLVIEDAAQGIGASWRGTDAGGLGDLSVLSFGRGKGWTGGCGGALLLREGSLHGRFVEARDSLPDSTALDGARNGAAVAAQWTLGRPQLYWLPAALPGLRLGETLFKPPRPPVRMPPLAAAVALAHHEAAQREVPVRRANAAALLTALAGAGIDPSAAAPCTPLAADDCGFLRQPVMLTRRGVADRVFESARRLGVGRGYPVALPDLPEAAGVALPGQEPCLGARELAARLITLPTHSLVHSAAVEELAAALAAGLVA